MLQEGTGTTGCQVPSVLNVDGGHVAYSWSVYEPRVGISASLPSPVLVLRAALRVPRVLGCAYGPEGAESRPNYSRSSGN